MEKFKIEKPIEKVIKTIRMPADLIDHLERLAAQNDVSFNRLIVQCCQYALDHMSED